MNVVGIGMPSFLLTLEEHDEWKAEGFLKHVLKVCLPAALTMVITILIVQILNGIFHWPEDIYSYFNVMLGALVSLLVVAQVCWPLNQFRKFVLGASVVVFLAAILILPKFYDIHSVWTPWSFLLIPLGVLIMMLIYWISRWTNILTAKYEASRVQTRKK
jgi:cation-transporting ATPase E